MRWKWVSKGVNAMREIFRLWLLQYQRLLNYIMPDVVHVMMDGRIVAWVVSELAVRLEQEGYASWLKNLVFDYQEKFSYLLFCLKKIGEWNDKGDY